MRVCADRTSIYIHTWNQFQSNFHRPTVQPANRDSKLIYAVRIHFSTNQFNNDRGSTPTVHRMSIFLGPQAFVVTQLVSFELRSKDMNVDECSRIWAVLPLLYDNTHTQFTHIVCILHPSESFIRSRIIYHYSLVVIDVIKNNVDPYNRAERDVQGVWDKC